MTISVPIVLNVDLVRDAENVVVRCPKCKVPLWQKHCPYPLPFTINISEVDFYKMREHLVNCK